MSKKPKNFDYSIFVIENAILFLNNKIREYQDEGRKTKGHILPATDHAQDIEASINNNKRKLNELWYAKKLLSENKP